MENRLLSNTVPDPQGNQKATTSAFNCRPPTFKWASTRENLSSGFANNTGADQPAHPRSLISAFVIRFFESTICKLATGEISIL